MDRVLVDGLGEAAGPAEREPEVQGQARLLDDLAGGVLLARAQRPAGGQEHHRPVLRRTAQLVLADALLRPQPGQELRALLTGAAREAVEQVGCWLVRHRAGA